MTHGFFVKRPSEGRHRHRGPYPGASSVASRKKEKKCTRGLPLTEGTGFNAGKKAAQRSKLGARGGGALRKAERTP